MFEVVAGRYVLIDSIGSGGSGEVWRAFDQKRGEYCAAKLIRRPEAATLVRAVFEQGVRLDHPHVVTPYAWAADDEQVLLAMPLVRGGSLAVLLRDHGVLPARYGAEVLRQLLVALEHVHAAGIVHRDVKPANVLLESTGTGAPHARLADFGLVLTPDRPRITGMFMVVGTRDYLAPESLEHGDQGIAQDLYAAGLVGAEMVGVHAGPLTGLIAALTAQDPARRPESATAALERLAEVLDGWPLRTPAPMPESDEPVEVFEQIGELPPGWGPHGPIADAETESVEWLWSPDPAEDTQPAAVEYGGAPEGSGSVESVEVPTQVLGSTPGAEQRTIPVSGARGERPGPAQGSQDGGVSGGWASQTVPLGGGSGGAPGVPGTFGTPGTPGVPGDRQAQGSQGSGVSGGWEAQTVPFGGRSGSVPGAPGTSGAPGERQPHGPQAGGASADWPFRTVPLGGGSGGVPGTPGGPGERPAQGPQGGGASVGWEAQTVPRAHGPQAGGGAPGDWQSRTVPLGGASSHAAGNRQAWNAARAEPDIDRVRLMPVLGTNPGAVPAATAAPSASRRRWQWAAMVAAAIALAGVVGAIVVAFH